MKRTLLLTTVIAALAAATTPPLAAAQRVAGAAPAYLPDPSCAPVESGSDDAAHAFQPPEQYVVKLVYAFASDSPNNFATAYPAMSQGARDMMEYVYTESGDRKSMRHDLGTVSGPDCVDIQRISLPHPASFYDPENVSAARAKVVADVKPQLGDQPGVRNYLIFADGVPNNFRSANTEPLPNDDSAAGAAWQRGESSAVIFDNNFSSGLGPAFGRVGAHELFHTFGAVQKSAPHHGGGAHCTEKHDLMCDQSFNGPQVCDFRASPTVGWSVVPALDCGGDDYVNPEPAAGSYLATHWNTYNSPFLCQIGSCAPDNIGPETTIAGPRRTRKTRPTFTLTIEPGATIVCRVDDEEFKVCGATLRPKLDVGPHTIEAFGVDAAGNFEAEASVHQVRIKKKRG